MNNATTKNILESVNMDVYRQFQASGKDFIEGGYGMAFMHYEKGQYADAYELFVLLAALSPEDKRMWMGLGAVAQMQKRYDESIEAYSIAAHLDSALKDPYPHFHAAECFHTMGDIKNAWKALDSARKIAGNDAQLSSRIALLRKSWYPKAKALAKKKSEE